jgi:hypothetical protein
MCIDDPLQMHGFTTFLRFADRNTKIRGMVSDHGSINRFSQESRLSSLFALPPPHLPRGRWDPTNQLPESEATHPKPEHNHHMVNGISTLAIIITTTTTIKNQHRRPHLRLPAPVPTNRRPSALLPASSFLCKCRPGCYSSPQTKPKPNPKHNHSPPAPDPPPGSPALTLASRPSTWIDRAGRDLPDADHGRTPADRSSFAPPARPELA